MKNLKGMIAMLAILFGLMITQNSCRDPCKDVECVNGMCEEGVCMCDAGYEGDNCGTAMNQKFLGTYSTTDKCTSPGYSQTISAGNAPNEIIFSNLGNFSTAAVVRTTVNGNSFTATDFTDATGRKFTTNGTISGTVITGKYTVTYSDGSKDENCEVTMTR
jgi:hypothetical protein